MFKEKTQSRQLHFQSIKTRILALTLALLTAFTALPSTTAYAEGSGTVSGNNNSQGGNTSIGGGVVGYGSGGFAKVNQGYRFYMIDNNFNRVTDVYDFVFSTPNAGAILTNSRFESISYSQSNWHLGSIDKLAQMAQGTQNASGITSIYPLTCNEYEKPATFYVHGSEFRQWFIGNGGGSIGTDHTQVSGGGGASSGGSSKPSTGNGKPSTGNGIKDYGNTYEDFSSLPSGIRENIAKSSSYLLSDPYTWQPKAKLMTRPAFDIKYGSQINTYTTMYLNNIKTIKSKYNTNNVMTADQIKRLAAMQILNLTAKNDIDKFLVNYVYRYVSTATVLSNAANQSLLAESIPLASGQKYPAEAILARKEFVPAGFNTNVDTDGIVTGIDALKYQENGEYKYYLVVEPLLCIGVTNASGGLIKKVYGSYYNVTQYWARYANNDNAYTLNRTLMKESWKQSLVVEKTYNNLSKIKPITSSSVALSSLTISQNLKLMEDGIGIGMHIYCASDLDPVSGTHTYDSLLGTTPGPAPDPSTLPQDSPDKGGNTITIIKNYVTEVNGTEQTDGNYIRKQNPHTIEIEDEPNYKVVEWNTSTKEAPDITNGSKLPWNDLIKTSTKTQVGNSSTAVELSKPEKVLYIKLKKTEGSSRNPEVAGDWVLSESELTKAVSSKQATIFLHKIWV